MTSTHRCLECKEEENLHKEVEIESKRNEFIQKIVMSQTNIGDLAGEIFDLKEEMSKLRREIHNHNWDL